MFIKELWEDEVEHYTITSGDYSVGIISFGAILQSFKFKDTDIVLGFDNFSGYKTQTAHLGQIVGPVANRIKNATFMLDGRKYELDKNNNGNSLHSGSKNFGDHNWKLKTHTEQSVALELVSEPQGGFDQTHEVEIEYSINETGELKLAYSIKTDKKCPVNLTNHAYFNLGGGDIRNSTVYFNSEKYIAVDDELIPTEIKHTENTVFDFRNPRKIGDMNNGNYDTCFILEKGSVTVENNGLRLTMTTDLPAFQLYTGIRLQTPEKGKSGRAYTHYDGFAIESSYYPDFVNRPDFAGHIQEPGETYRTTTIYKLEKL